MFYNAFALKQIWDRELTRVSTHLTFLPLETIWLTCRLYEIPDVRGKKALRSTTGH